MILKTKRLSPLYFLGTGLLVKSEDMLNKRPYNVNDLNEDFKDYDSLTPWERVKEILQPVFQPTVVRPNEDYAMIATAATVGVSVGAVLGAIKYSNEARKRFIENNDASKFSNVHEAKVKLNNSMMKGAVKGGISNGLRIGFLTGTYTLLSVCGAAYRGKNGILEHLLAGITVGALYKINYGLRGMIAGSVLGLTLGSIYGVFYCVGLKVFGLDYNEVRRESYNLYMWTTRGQQVTTSNSNSIAPKEFFSRATKLEQKKMLETQDLPVTLEILPDEPEKNE